MAAELLEYLVIPGLAWVALRHGRRHVSLGLIALTAISLAATWRGFGPFVRSTPIESAVGLVAYLGAMTLVTLVVARVAAGRAHAEARLLEISATDGLTGLGNYRRLLDVLRAEIARSNRTNRPFAVLVVDIDGLKRINDYYGYLGGTQALLRVSNAIRQCCRTTDTPARFGGDEFAVVLTETDRVGAERLLERVSEWLRVGDEKPPVQITGGIAAYPADGGTPGKLLSVAGDVRHQPQEGPASAGLIKAG